MSMPDNRPKPHTDGECGQRFHLPLHTSCTVDYLSTPLSGGAYRVLCPVRSPVTTLDCSLLKVGAS
jgi:hypothetical protein